MKELKKDLHSSRVRNLTEVSPHVLSLRYLVAGSSSDSVQLSLCCYSILSFANSSGDVLLF